MFVDIFNELLEENELNRKQFSEKSGIPYTTVVGWTNLNRLPDYTALIKLADFFHCSIDFLTGREETSDSITPYSVKISPQEQILLKNFRSLDHENKDLVLRISKSLVRPQK